MDTDYSKALSQQTCIISLKAPMTASNYLEKHVRQQFLRYFQQKAEKQRGGTFENAAKCGVQGPQTLGPKSYGAPFSRALQALKACKRRSLSQKA